MATSPAPPRPPAPSRSSPVIVIVLLVLALIITVAGMAVWVGLHFISRAVHVETAQGSNGQKAVSVRTPIGSLEVNPQVSEASLGLPVYPGAARMKDDDWAATIKFNFADDANVRVLAGKFETTDPFEKVRDFYRERLGNQVTKYQDKDQEGKTVFEIKGDKQKKVVALRSLGGKTVIDLARGYQMVTEAN